MLQSPKRFNAETTCAGIHLRSLLIEEKVCQSENPGGLVTSGRIGKEHVRLGLVAVSVSTSALDLVTGSSLNGYSRSSQVARHVGQSDALGLVGETARSLGGSSFGVTDHRV